MVEPISFYVNEDFRFKIGAKQKEITVPRMSFLTGGDLITKIAEVQGKDIRGAIDLLIRAKNGEGVTGDISTSVVALIKEKNYGLIVEILSMISERAITDVVIKENKCQFDEVVKILIHLVDGNFSSLKNLSASLKAITSSGQ